MANLRRRYVSTAAQRTQHGARYRLVSTSVSTALRTTVTWVSTSPLSDPRTSTVRQHQKCIHRGNTDQEQSGNGTSYES